MFDEKKAVQLMRAVGGVKVRAVTAPSYARVADGWIETSDIDHNLRLRVGAPDGVVDVRTALKAQKLTGTYTDAFPAAECVPFPAVGGVEINPALFRDLNGVLSLDFVECAAKDETRGTLCGVFIGRGAICATDGHRMLMRPVTTTEGADMIITVKTVELLKKLPPVTAACYNSKDRWLILNGNSYQLTVKTIDGVYPDFEKCIPTGQNCVAELSAAEVAELRAGVDTLIPFLPGNNMVKFTGELATAADRDKGKFVGVNIPALSLRSIAFNGVYLSKLLSNFPGGVDILTPVATQEQYEKDKAAYDKISGEYEALTAAKESADRECHEAEAAVFAMIDDVRATVENKDEAAEMIHVLGQQLVEPRKKIAAARDALSEFKRTHGEYAVSAGQYLIREPLPPDEANKVGLISAVVFKAGDVTGLQMPLRILDDDGVTFDYAAPPEMLPVKTPAPAPVVARKPEPRPAAKKPTGKISPEIEMLVAALVGVVGEEQLGRELSEMLKFARNHGAKAMYAAA